MENKYLLLINLEKQTKKIYEEKFKKEIESKYKVKLPQEVIDDLVNTRLKSELFSIAYIHEKQCVARDGLPRIAPCPFQYEFLHRFG